MANVHTKEHMFVMVKGKNGLERREVKSSSADYKIKDQMQKLYDQARSMKRKRGQNDQD